MSTDLLSSTFESARGNNAAATAHAREGVFYKEGEFWSIGLGGKTVRLKDSKGLAYLAYLLRHPGTEFHALDLAGGIASRNVVDEADGLPPGLGRRDDELESAGIHIGGLGDAGDILDDQAKRAYRQRLSELREELEEAKALGKAERAEELEAEIDALTGELSRAVGLGGRSRRAASASERARQTITKTIRAVIQRIARTDPAVGEFFARSIKTGIFCSYQPDPDLPIKWQFAASRSKPISITEAAAGADHMEVAAAAPAIVAFSTAQRTPFVGREHESHVIRAVIEQAHHGRGSLLMLAGGPGVGKTRLALEMTEYAAPQGFACFLGRCYEGDEPLPYLPFVQTIEAMMAQAPSIDEFRRQIDENAPELAQLVPRLRRIFPDIPKSIELPDPQKRRYLFQSVTEVLARAARTRPHLLILDDLQWADESTLALLTHLANHVAQLPMVIIGTYRDEYFEDHPALARTLEELIRQGIRPLKLIGLAKDSVAQMLGELGQRQVPETLVSAIFEESNGNPFFVEEVYRHLLEEGKVIDSGGQFRTEFEIDEIDVPDNVRLIIARRLKRFTELEMRALSAAAVIGRSFSFQLLSTISQINVDELFTVLDKVQHMGIIVPSAEGPEKPFIFAHELVRQTLFSDISVARRQQLHAKVAAAIEQLYPTALNEHSGEIADHLLKAGAFAERETLVRWLTQAGKSALEAAAFEAARNRFGSALSRVDEEDLHQRVELLDSSRFAERGLGRWNEASRNWDEALDLYTVLDNHEGIAKTCFRASAIAYWSGAWRESTEIAERNLGRLPKLSRNRALILAGLGVNRGIDGRFHAAQESFATALAASEELFDNNLKGAILGIRWEFDFYALRFHEALEDSRRSVELSPSPSRWIRAERLLWRQTALYHLGRVQEAARIEEELKPLVSKIGYAAWTPLFREMAAWVDFWKQADLAQLEDTLRGDLDANANGGLRLLVSMSLEQLSIAEFLRAC